MTSKFILSKLKEALEKFGTYSFDDKGPDEVMNTQSIINELKTLSSEQAGLILKEVSLSKNERGKRLAECLVSGLDDMPEEWFENLLKISEVEY
jgi:hypothetical protein